MDRSDYDSEDDQQNWTIPDTQEQEEDTTPLFENVSPQPKSSERDSVHLHQLYYIDQGEWNDFQNNQQSNQLSPTLDNVSPSLDSSQYHLQDNLLLGIKQEPPTTTLDKALLIGTSLPSFIRKKLPKEEQEKFANTRLLMFNRDYFFAVMDEENDELDRLVCIDKADLTLNPKDDNYSVKRRRTFATSDDEEESIDSECDLYVDEAESDESADYKEYEEYVDFEEEDVAEEEIEKPKPVKPKRTRASSSKENRVSSLSSQIASSSSSAENSSSTVHRVSSTSDTILVHFFADKIEEGRYLSSTIYAPCRTKTGAKAVKPNAYVNKRTTIKQTDKTLLLTISNPFGNLNRHDFEICIIVDDSFHGEELKVRDQLNDKEMLVKKLIKDPEEEDLLTIVHQKKVEEGWEIGCQVSTSNNFGWKSKHKYYKFLILSNIQNVHSCVSEEFRVSQNCAQNMRQSNKKK
ncbi:predicted protein [Naegleria gruberi]|uniref:Predicted protein n=1 Tax=Naegleria gruberi TaxID=5762 RepID=D2V4V7_NAEGR|nr:uncharacterized protein NAEGRDRAFT_46726 [Naegleria gruberi]EFC47998.1 predicted protein [Naegleria gruberi]|eukprot:XP_002680742.1 predicted protein [Naegleria gruberi strain NEG-M]